MKMKKLGLIIFAVLVFFSVNLNAQNTRYDNDKGTNFVNNLWYGTSFGGLGFTDNTFAFGTAPMVGYKLLEGTSLGVRVPVRYFYRKDSYITGETITLNDWDLGIGAFARQKLFFNIFAHAEVNTIATDLILVDPNGNLIPRTDDNTKAVTQRITEQQANVGFGYSNGNGGLGYEFSIMYDFLADRTQPFAPINIRAGLNYKF